MHEIEQSRLDLPQWMKPIQCICAFAPCLLIISDIRRIVSFFMHCWNVVGLIANVVYEADDDYQAHLKDAVKGHPTIMDGACAIWCIRNSLLFQMLTSYYI